MEPSDCLNVPENDSDRLALIGADREQLIEEGRCIVCCGLIDHDEGGVECDPTGCPGRSESAVPDAH